jgi:hypothetical protein
MIKTFETNPESGPWNPGIESALPPEFLPLSTIFRAENVSCTLAELHELSGFSGISIEDLTQFRPERLAVHELLIRITADLSVPDGTRYEDLGTNFRRMASTILLKYILPHIGEVKQLHGGLQRNVSNLLSQELQVCFGRPAPTASLARDRRGLFGRLGFNMKAAAAPSETRDERDLRIVTAWKQKAAAAETPLERKVYEALVRIANAVARKHGKLIGDTALLSALAIPLVCNDYGSEMIGAHIERYFRRAVSAEGYSHLPPQAHPVVMNVKGASASGKSTMRPLQKQLAGRLGVRWEEFALISPDIWRKFLLDYNSLGPARRYAGTLTGHEVAIIDRKLDRYMTAKGETGRISHLLIDRFRFDSFSAGEEDGSRLLTRFGHVVYMFFMITPPEATVERAWKRGEQFGRYKAVDDLLYHNVEAYSGMPRLLFTWTGKQHKQVHFEFLDNSVPEGCRPRTVAFGTSGEMNVLDVGQLLDIDRFKKININARRPEEVYTADLLAPQKNTDFLRQCVRTIPVINFAEQDTGRIYAKVQDGTLICGTHEPADPGTKAGLAAVAAELPKRIDSAEEVLRVLIPEETATLGIWGAGRNLSPGWKTQESEFGSPR